MTKIAPAPNAFEGSPKLNLPAVYGASPKKPLIYKIPAVGKLPMRYMCIPELPYGLTLDRDTGIITGAVMTAGEYKVVIYAKNELGADEKTIVFKIEDDKVCLTPLLGWTSWNAFRNRITQEDIKRTAELLVSTGLASYGYQYVNIDSGWQGQYGGVHDAIQTNAQFTNMKQLSDDVHALGLKLGIYSTPMLKAWGGGDYPGCTRGALDKSSIDTYFGIGVDHCEKNNVDQWEEWGIDYVKYDWAPCDVKNASLMKEALKASKRDYAFCVTVSAGINDADYWKTHCNSWRANEDSYDVWKNVAGRFEHDNWAEHCNSGHYFDLDMLETGYYDGHACRLTEDEQILSYTIRALFPSPIQISCDLSKLTDFDRALLCNDEVLAVNQDPLAFGAVCVNEFKTRTLDRKESIHTKTYVKRLSDGSHAAGFFNIGDAEANAVLSLNGTTKVRDLWAKEDLPNAVNGLAFKLAPHSVRLVKITRADD